MKSFKRRRTFTYDVGKPSFQHDRKRDQLSECDFYLLAIASAFSYRNLISYPLHWISEGKLITIFLSGITLIFGAVPIYFIQSSMGQFSRSGFLSVFRVSPLFKGIGYAILISNVISMPYYSTIAAHPIAYMFDSMLGNLPWTTCDNLWNTQDCNLNITRILQAQDAPCEYYRINLLSFGIEGNLISLKLIGGCLFVWMFVYLMFCKGIKSITIFLRFSTILAFTLLLILFFGISFQSDASTGIQKRVLSNNFESGLLEFMVFSPFLNCLMLGQRKGTILTLASCNSFKRDTFKFSLIVPYILLGFTILGSLITYTIQGLLEDKFGILIPAGFEGDLLKVPFIHFAYYFGQLNSPHLWSTMFYLMIFLFEFNGLVIQMFCVSTSIFDEYPATRDYKRYVPFVICGIMFFTSVMYCTQFGFAVLQMMLSYSGVSQLFICFIELLVFVWIYGRRRFQRDIYFMIEKWIGTWKFYTIRLITPVFIAIALILNIIGTGYYISKSHVWISGLILILKIVPWFIILGYAFWKVHTTGGSMKRRIIKCVKPLDWYPPDPEAKRRYDQEITSLEAFERFQEIERWRRHQPMEVYV